MRVLTCSDARYPVDVDNEAALRPAAGQSSIRGSLSFEAKASDADAETVDGASDLVCQFFLARHRLFRNDCTIYTLV